MEINTQKYDPQKIERLKQFLEKQAAKQQARYFEIYVDNLKAVPRTNDIAEFDSYAEFLDENTERIKVKIYSTSQTSAHHDLHVFITNSPAEQQKEQGLSGIEIKSEINKEVSLAKERWEADQVKKELADKQKELEQAEQYIEKLEGRLEEASSKRKMGDVQWGEVASLALEGVMRRNAHLLAAIPGAEGLAGVIHQDTMQRMNPQNIPQQADAEASFKKKETDPQVNPTEQQKGYIAFVEQLETRFDQEEMQKIMFILNSLANDPSQIDPVAELITGNPEQEDQSQMPSSI